MQWILLAVVLGLAATAYVFIRARSESPGGPKAAPFASIHTGTGVGAAVTEPQSDLDAAPSGRAPLEAPPEPGADSVVFATPVADRRPVSGGSGPAPGPTDAVAADGATGSAPDLAEPVEPLVSARLSGATAQGWRPPPPKSTRPAPARGPGPDGDDETDEDHGRLSRFGRTDRAVPTYVPPIEELVAKSPLFTTAEILAIEEAVALELEAESVAPVAPVAAGPALVVEAEGDTPGVEVAPGDDVVIDLVAIEAGEPEPADEAIEAEPPLAGSGELPAEVQGEAEPEPEVVVDLRDGGGEPAEPAELVEDADDVATADTVAGPAPAFEPEADPVDQIIRALVDRARERRIAVADVAAELVEQAQLEDRAIDDVLADLVDRVDATTALHPNGELTLFNSAVPRRPGRLSDLDRMTNAEKKRVIIRVLCLLVATRGDDQQEAVADYRTARGEIETREWPLARLAWPAPLPAGATVERDGEPLPGRRFSRLRR